jgi:UDP-glucose 4-epimerase
MALERDVRESLADVLVGVDVVFHLAAQVSVPLSVADPVGDATTNALGTVMLLDGCRAAGVRRFVYASSAAVYGRPDYLPIDEQHPTDPLSPYGLSKLTGERYARLSGQLYGIDVIALRYFNVYGPGQPVGGGYAGVLTLFLDAVRRGAPLRIEGDGTQTRDFVHVRDVVAANLLAAASNFQGVLNVGTGHACSIGEVARIVGGTGYPVESVPARSGDIPHSVASIAAAQRVLGYEPTITLADGLREM